MVHLNEMPAENRDRLVNQEVPVNDGAPWTEPPDIAKARVAIVTTAGLHRKDDRPFRGGAGDYRVIPGDIDLADLRLSHVSTNFDRLAWQHDVNTVFPVDRLRELAAEGAIGSVAAYHYSFMGATPPETMEAAAHDLAQVLKGDDVDIVLLMGV
jgi:D-proline reductase (dithiol) PrdB